MRIAAVAVLVLAACHRTGPRPIEISAADLRAAQAAPAYDGVTTCGPAAPAPDPAPPPAAWTAPAAGAAFVDGPAPRGELIHGSLDKSLVSRAIKAHSTAIQVCYLKRLEVDPTTAGRVRADFQILGDGSVADLSINGFDRALDACLCHEMAAIRFPAVGVVIRVSYPFVFSTGP